MRNLWHRAVAGVKGPHTGHNNDTIFKCYNSTWHIYVFLVNYTIGKLIFNFLFTQNKDRINSYKIVFVVELNFGERTLLITLLEQNKNHLKNE